MFDIDTNTFDNMDNAVPPLPSKPDEFYGFTDNYGFPTTVNNDGPGIPDDAA